MGEDVYITQLQEAFACRPDRFAEVDRFAKRAKLGPGTRVLEVGCGAGEASAHLAREYGCVATGVDVDASRLPRSAADGLFACADAESLPFGDGAFDAAFAEAVWSHVADRERAARELHRVLAPGALVMIADFSRDAGDMVQVDAQEHGPDAPIPRSAVAPFARIASFDTYLESLGGAGFTLVEAYGDRSFPLRLYAHLMARGLAVTPGSLFGQSASAPTRMAYRIAYLEA